ncbi:MAG TPA: response regulator [Tepidisphaeraceae bacterium]|jgi:putative two-component system response regulator|nr:response regulator [Tepidisphaeraceae bacterium]
MNMRVLIVDDNALALIVLRKALVAAGYEVISAVNGREALDLLRDGSCRLVISDMEMPEMDGLDLCRAIRADGTHGYVYVMLLTSHDSREERVAGRRAGADDFISKPFDREELLARLETAERILSLETRDVTIFAMARLAESRDPETGAHLERVRAYSRVLAKHLAELDKFRSEISAEYIRLIYLTSPLHDIGKVGIPDSVLLKPGRLSDREFEIMKTHAMLGAQTLDAAMKQFPGVKFLQMARDIAATHHERFDGTGYSNRLAGCAIPLCGRIVALADVYDALTSRRVYKDAIGHDIARSIILSESGAHFDPDIVEAFAVREREFAAIRLEFAEHQAVAA